MIQAVNGVMPRGPTKVRTSFEDWAKAVGLGDLILHLLEFVILMYSTG